MNDQPTYKIYQIGFGLTGVLSLYHYLLGNKVNAVHWDQGNLSRAFLDNLHNNRPLFSGYESYQAYLNLEHVTEDGEIVNVAERHLDKIYGADPSGLFIFNVQPVESLIEARASLYGYLPAAMKYYNASEEEVFERWRTSYWSQLARVEQIFAGSNRFFVYDISQNKPADLDVFFSQHGFNFCSDHWQDYQEVRGSVDLSLHIRNVREAALYFRYHRDDLESAIALMHVSEKYKPCNAYFRDELKTWEEQAKAGALTKDPVPESESGMGKQRKQNMNDKTETLVKLGAEQFGHINGSLLKHLSGTQDILVSWDAPAEVCDAGFYHAIYGPDGLGDHLLSLEQRDVVAQTIGSAAEALVYLYCACDKAFVLPQLGGSEPVIYRDRFTGEEHELAEGSLTDLCEILAANEIDVCSNNADKGLLHSERTRTLLQSLVPHVRARAQVHLTSILETPPA